MLVGRRLSTWVAVAVILATAIWVVRYRVGAGFFPAFDLYAYFYPKVLYALASLRDGGRGLLWNPFQNCGQPFFGTSQTGLLYPPYLLFLLFETDLALRLVITVHLAIGGLGTYLLARELGARTTAALAAALVFQMGNAMIALTISSPTHAAPYAWMPMALLGCERLLRAPDLRRAAALALVLAVAILPGMPQIVFFIYQVLVLRILFELATQPVARRPPLALVAVALLTPVLLAAVQLLPESEVARLSLRGTSLTLAELGPFGRWESHIFRRELLTHSLSQPFLPVPCMIGAAALLASSTRRPAVFYGVLGLIYFALSLGPGSPVFELYSRLPGGLAFRDPSRFTWVSSFALAVVTALGLEALAWCWEQRSRRAVLALPLMIVPPLLLWLVAWTAPDALRHEYENLWRIELRPWQLVFSRWDWWAAALALAAAALATARGFRTLAPATLLAAIAISLLGSHWTSNLYLLENPPAYFASRPAFEVIAPRRTAQDRVYLVHEHPTASGFTFMAKTASLFRVPDILDYEPLLTQRYADFSLMLRVGMRVRSLSDILLRGPEPGPGFSRRLLDLTAARYLIVAPRFVPTIEQMAPPLTHLRDAAGLSVWENPSALPRAFFVPRLEVVTPPKALLDRLATGSDDLRQVALVEEAPPSGFTGAAATNAPASALFLRDEPEHLIIQVDAPARGFLVLSDQDFPGWLASVDGHAVPIQRANYAFRTVEVPAGRSSVEFRYAPRSLLLGTGVSALTCVGLLVAAVGSRRHGRSPAAARHGLGG